MKLENLIALCNERLEVLFHSYLTSAHYPDKTLQQAMSYAVQNGGKRIRPLLVYACGYLFNTSWEKLDAPACAIELIHTYSLIHDDLPAMDNSDLRRGKPSCHKAFNEGIAILAGDALQPLAFEIIATHPSALTTEQRLEMITVISYESGVHGMASGQGLDLAGIQSLENLRNMYALKTGALLCASMKLGLIASQIQDKDIQAALETYIKNIGLAFQIQDDLLDIEGDVNKTGKPLGLDANNHKLTYPALLGIPKTREIIEQLFSKALQSIEFLGNNAEILRELAYHLLLRKK